MKDNFSISLRIALAGAITMCSVMGIGRFVYTPILPFMTEALHLSGSQAGLIASANFLGYLLGALAASLKLPGAPRHWLFGALLGSALTSGAVGLFSDVGAIALIRFLGGLASAFGLIFSSSLVMEGLAQTGRRNFIWVHFAGVGIGIAVSALLVLLMTRFSEDWPAMWLASGAVSLACAALVAGMLPTRSTGPAPAAAAEGKAPRKAGGNGGLIRLILAYGLFGFGYVVTATFLVAIMRGEPALRAYEPIAWLAVGLAAIPSVAFWQFVARGTGFERGYAIACAAEAIGVLCSLVSGIAGALAAAILMGGTFVGITALGFEAARIRAPNNPRRVFGLMTAAFGVGQIVGPSVAGYMRDLTGSFAEASIAAAATLVIAAALTAGSRV